MTQFPEVSASRQDIRQLIRQRRRALSAEQQTQFAQQAAARMMAYPPVVMANTVALFLSFDGELDTQPLIDQLWRAGKKFICRCCIPLAGAICCFCTTIRTASWW